MDSWSPKTTACIPKEPGPSSTCGCYQRVLAVVQPHLRSDDVEKPRTDADGDLPRGCSSRLSLVSLKIIRALMDERGFVGDLLRAVEQWSPAV